jgi:hypothetical protein
MTLESPQRIEIQRNISIIIVPRQALDLYADGISQPVVVELLRGANWRRWQDQQPLPG